MDALATELIDDDGGLVASAGERLRSLRDRDEDRLEPVRAQAREVTREAAESAAGALEQTQDAIEVVRGVAVAAASLAGRVVRLVAVVPATAARLLDAVGRLLGGAERRGRELVHAIEAPRRARRRRRLVAAGLFLGGFASGAAVGWVLHDRLHEHPAEPHGAGTRDEPHTGVAASIDARRAR